MQVVCIDNKNVSFLLSIGKIYEIRYIHNWVNDRGISFKYYHIKTDRGHTAGFDTRCFKPLSEIRKNKLKKLKKC